MSDSELQALVHARPCRPLEVRAAELIPQGAGIYLAPPADDLDITHELASTLYALHIVERHDRARGSARAAAFRASESVRTRAALRDHALACLDAALEYVSGAGDEMKDDDDDDVLLFSRPLPVKERYTTREWSELVPNVLSSPQSPRSSRTTPRPARCSRTRSSARRCPARGPAPGAARASPSATSALFSTTP